MCRLPRVPIVLFAFGPFVNLASAVALTGGSTLERPFDVPLNSQIAIFLAGISFAGMAGLDEFREASENLPNPLIDAGVVGVAFYLWVEEVSLSLFSFVHVLGEKIDTGRVRFQRAGRIGESLNYSCQGR